MQNRLTIACAALAAIFLGGLQGQAMAETVKCKGDYEKCLRKARDACNGPFKVIDRERHRGGLVSDALPGPIWWYTVEVRCRYQNDNDGYDGGDFADGYGGGPDSWVVSGIGYNDTLKVRAAPSPSARMLGRLPPGVVVRNLGCRPAAGGRWCRISPYSNPGLRGWVNGRFLRER